MISVPNVRPDPEAVVVARQRIMASIEDARYHGGAFGPGVAGLEGVGDLITWISNAARTQWDAAVSQLRNLAGPFFSLGPQLDAAKTKLDRASILAGKDPRISKATADRISALQMQNRTLRNDHDRLDTKVRDLLRKAGYVERGQVPPEGLGIEPVTVVIGISAIAVIAAVVGAMVIHSGKAREHLRELALVEAGLLTPDQLADIRKESDKPMDLFGVAGLGKSLAVVALVAAAVWFIPKRRAL